MIYQFKIELKNVINPTVWRRLLVSSESTFEEFHRIIQTAFGWENAHLFFFASKGYSSSPLIEMIYDDDFWGGMSNKESLDATSVLLSDIFIKAKQKYVYLYDSGDDWFHQLTLEKILPIEEGKLPILLAGEGTCPPEDCGGPWGYENLKEILVDKKHPEHKEMKEWLGLKPRELWNANNFDLENFNRLLNSRF